MAGARPLSPAAVAAAVRFEGQLNLDLNEVTTNLVPYPRLHFLLSSLSPLAAPRDVGGLAPGVGRGMDQVRPGLACLTGATWLHACCRCLLPAAATAAATCWHIK
jgi:hypothetical protein